MAPMAVLPAAATLDLSRLPPFQLVAVNYEAERAQLLERARIRLEAANHVLDVDDETNPIVIFGEEVAYTRTLGLQQINDGGKRLTVAYGDGEALDHIAATFYAELGEDVLRLPGELDDRYRWRLMLVANARVPGSLPGYMFWALTKAPRLTDAQALNHASGLVPRGTIAVILLGDPDDEGPTGEAAQVELARAALLDTRHNLGTDTLQIRAASRLDASLSAQLVLDGPGPDATVVRDAALARLSAFLKERRRIGAEVSMTSLAAALTVPGVLKVNFASPTDDLAPSPDQVVRFTSIDLTTAVAGD